MVRARRFSPFFAIFLVVLVTSCSFVFFNLIYTHKLGISIEAPFLLGNNASPKNNENANPNGRSLHEDNNKQFSNNINNNKNQLNQNSKQNNQNAQQQLSSNFSAIAFNFEEQAQNFWFLIDTVVFSDTSAPYQSKSCQMIKLPEFDNIAYQNVEKWKSCPASNRPISEFAPKWNCELASFELYPSITYEFKSPESVSPKNISISEAKLLPLSRILEQLGMTTKEFAGKGMVWLISYLNQTDILYSFPKLTRPPLYQTNPNALPTTNKIDKNDNTNSSSSSSSASESSSSGQNSIPFKPNVILFVLDSVPRSYFSVYMPQTTKYLKDRHSRKNAFTSFSFGRFHSQPGSTTANMTPMLTNKRWVLSSAVERAERYGYNWEKFTTVPINQSDWIQAKFQKEGYATMMASADGPRCTAFPHTMNPKLNWDFITPLYLPTCSAGSPYRSPNRPCFNDHSHTETAFSAWRQLRKQVTDRPLFGYIHLLEAHDSGQKTKGGNVVRATALDPEFVNFFEEIEAQNDTVIVFLSDHGSWIVHNRPFLHLLIPQRLLTSANDPGLLFMRLFQNQLGMISGFDIHRTLHHLAQWPAESPPFLESSEGFRPSISLFEATISEERTCEEARIPLDHCFCEPWITPEMRKLTNNHFRWLGDFSLLVLNSDSGIKNHLCPQFKLEAVDSIGWKEKDQFVYYQLEITVLPGSLKYHLYLKQDKNATKKFLEQKPIINYPPTPAPPQQTTASPTPQTATTKPPTTQAPPPPPPIETPIFSVDEVLLETYYPLLSRVNSTIGTVSMMATKIKQITRYHEMKVCIPAKANPEFCFCNPNHQ